MIDIHSHIIYAVDDGAKTLAESKAMLQDAANQGVKAMVATPHCRRGMFTYDSEKIEQHLFEMQAYAKELGIALFQGTEYHVDSNLIAAFRECKCHTLADSRYILTEYASGSEFPFLKQMTDEIVRNGYIPVIAHIERYRCIVEEPKRAGILQDMGAWVQVNADAVLGKDGRGPKKFCKMLLKENLVDVIASDCHGIDQRASHMQECYKYICKKYGQEDAEALFYENPLMILHNEDV